MTAGNGMLNLAAMVPPLPLRIVDLLGIPAVERSLELQLRAPLSND
jgi:hypothetical protein